MERLGLRAAWGDPGSFEQPSGPWGSYGYDIVHVNKIKRAVQRPQRIYSPSTACMGAGRSQLNMHAVVSKLALGAGLSVAI